VPLALAYLVALLILLLLTRMPALAAEPGALRNSYGETGLLDMPSARMAGDGELAFTIGGVGDSQRVGLSFQFLPWLETSFRYSRLGNWNGETLYDRSFSLKTRLLNEGDYLPDLSIGLRDVLGTGVYGAEYIAASKRLGAVDLTAGMGWGRLAGTGALANPLRMVSGDFRTRKAFAGEGGEVDFGQFFHGEKASLFGGLTWRTPVEGLSFAAEYSSDTYDGESRGPHGMVRRTPVNLGLTYRLTDTIALTGGWFYGSTYGFSVSLTADPAEATSAVKIGPDVPPPALRSSSEQQGALARMQVRNARLFAMKDGIRPAPGIAPTDIRALSRSLAGEGVRDVDVAGATLLVNARRSGAARGQCARVARAAAGMGLPVTSIAISNLDDTGGQVSVCPVPAMEGLQFAAKPAPAAIAQAPLHDSAIAIGDDAAIATAEITPVIANAPPPPVLDERQTGDSLAQQPGKAALETALRADFAAQYLALDGLVLGDSDLWLYVENTHYARDSEAVGRSLRLAMARAPPEIEIFHIVTMKAGMALRETTIARSALERVSDAHGAAGELGGAVSLAAPAPPPAGIIDGAYPKPHWSFGPLLRQNFFDPETPLQIQILAAAQGAVEIAPGWSVEAAVSANLYNNYNIKRVSDSLLPHVRSDIMRYIDQGEAGLTALQTVYRRRLSSEWFAEARAGYLEDMYMGAGGQLLWRPEGSRFAFGADLYQVWKRDYNRLFGAQSYNALTGHVSLYYRSPWYGLNFNLHAGRYLARDNGVTVEITRRFSTGVEIGAFATFTDVPFRKFGEGSFDKGIFIRIPFEWALPIYSRSSYDLNLHALTRHGGQRLAGDDSLYEETRGADYGEFATHLDDVVAP
jgi:hypothetical protein